MAWPHEWVSPVVPEDAPVKLIRNVSLIAHIDAGKTTTTERMLYFAHRTRHLGEVDRGDTVTDYLPEERERGISIISATACLTWKQHTFHLIDTPGHVDFTMEVERSLSVVDGAVTILDATEGVQAQSRTVWLQADRYSLPRLVFVNKMDRETADFRRSVASLSAQLTSRTVYLPIHWPVYNSCLLKPMTDVATTRGRVTVNPKNSHFIGLVDLTNMKFQDWSNCSFPHFHPTTINLLPSGTDYHPILRPESMDQVVKARTELLEQLAEVDEELADQFLALDRPESLLPFELVRSALRRATHAGRVVPVLIGSSRNNIGIQPLMDAITDYLPDPTSRPPPAVVGRLFHQHSALAEHVIPRPSVPVTAPIMLVFKICFDPHRGPLTLVRVYSGSVKRDCSVTNWSRFNNRPVVEKVQGVFQLTGENHEVIDHADVGSIVALSGLKSTYSGDLLGPPITQSDTSDSYLTLVSDESLGDGSVQLEPVVYAALEPNSLSAVRTMQHALACMQREDPSFVAKADPETGQWTVGGMGDLHLEIVFARLQREYKMNARMGPLLIAYKECPGSTTFERNPSSGVPGFSRLAGVVDGVRTTVAASITVERSDQYRPQIRFDRSWFALVDCGNAESIRRGFARRLELAVRDACLSSLQVSGPLLRSPIVFVSVIIHRLVYGRTDDFPTSVDRHVDIAQLSMTSNPSHVSHSASAALLALFRSAISSAVRDAVSKLTDWRLMEPMMRVELRLPTNESGESVPISRFLGDLVSRRADILAVDAPNETSNEFSHRWHTIEAVAPLSELVGYSTTVRTLSSGRADLSLQLSAYRPVSVDHQKRLLDQLVWSPNTSS